MSKPPDPNSYMICLIPPETLRGKFMRAAAHAPEGSDIQSEADLHVTLTSLQIPKKKSVRDLVERLKQIEFPAFDIRINDVAVFNRPPARYGRSKPAFFNPDGVSGNEIQELHNQIIEQLKPAGYQLAQDDFRPHMTLLRYDFNTVVQKVRDFLKACAGEDYPDWNVDRFYLTRKRLQEDSANDNNGGDDENKFEVIASIPLVRP